MSHKKYDHILANIETRIVDLGLGGKIIRLNITNNINEIVDYEIKRGAKTIIAVGNDQTINHVINSIANCQEVPLGIIPIGKENNNIANALGINTEETACEILSARRISCLDVGLANNTYFLSHVSSNNQETILEISQNYSVETTGKGEIKIINLLPYNENLPFKTKINPQDGILELFIKTTTTKKLFFKEVGHSFFQIKKIIIKNKKFPIILDGCRSIKSPVEISLLRKKLNIIVGRNRNF
ncbi:MAG: diacylglycerol kinase family protein [Patescibacteria group bacterium]|nr:hypothetical protein [Patescibacteria group bacterium]MBU1870816.1 hypothetical protein [Patescibacteria group bacterium]